MNQSIWQEVVKTATIGTGRRGLKSLPDNQLGEMLRRLDSSDCEGTLLRVAGAIALYQQAGKLLESEQQILPPPSEDDLPCCSQKAGQHLELMLTGNYTQTLPEWLAVAAETGKRVPPGCLIQLLTLGKRQRNFRELILPVLGKRGHWLAAQNPDWNYAAGETDNSFFPRQLSLKRLREQDPEAARKQLEKTWKKENSEERASLLQVLEINLSMNDEPFLEAALENRRKQVRDVAAKLLAKLPSRLTQRMMQRVRLLVAFSHNRLHITLPTTCDMEMTRDGIDESRYSAMLGEKASWLLQMISYLPLNFWCNLSGKTPKELLQIIAGSQWEKLLLEAWGIAAVRSQDLAWAEVLLKNCSKFHEGYLVSSELLIQDLLKVVSEDSVNALILETLLQHQTQLLNQKHPAFLLLRKSCFPWSVEISKLVLSSIRRHLEVNSIIEGQLNLAMQNFAFYMNVFVVDEAATSLSAGLFEGSYWQNFVDEFLATLRFRFEMIEALRGE